MKNLVLLLIAITVFLSGIIFKLIHLPGAGILMVLGLGIFIVYSSIIYFKNKNPVMKKVLIISSIVLITTLVFAIIKYPYFSETVLGAILAGFIIFLLSLLFNNKKRNLIDK
ncbi:MAG TPA: hypothetical protein VMV47_11950 [Bacteroidales bacterium]|nr:hypothetical protein [Bacteroidales bacterium]